MIFLLGLLAACWNYVTLVTQPKALRELTKNTLEPGILNTIAERKSQVSLDNSNIRLPFGQNPLVTRQLPDATFFTNNRYQQAYQRNINNVYAEQIDHRIPEAEFMNERNQFTNYSLREATFQKINDYWKRRRNHEISLTLNDRQPQ